MDESDEDVLLTPAFAIDQNLLKNGVVSAPRDGLQFLANVVLERRTCQDVVTASLPDLNNKQNIFAPEIVKLNAAPACLLPTLEWQNYQVADFSTLRTRISKLYNRKEVWIHSVKFPPIDKKLSDELWTSFLQNHEPDLSLIFTMKQYVLEFLIDFLIEILNNIPKGEGIDQASGRWIFAVLTLLKFPLSPDACSSLRDLARKCSQIRANLSTDDENVAQKVAPLNLFICLTARYFRQGDLAD